MSLQPHNARMHRYRARPRIRIVRSDDTIVLGPGKADLLEAIDREGSIRKAAAELGMSYMRAWTLVRTMNAAFRSPLVEKIRGGTEKGGARLTGRGAEVLRIYRKMEARAQRSIDALWDELRAQL